MKILIPDKSFSQFFRSISAMNPLKFYRKAMETFKKQGTNNTNTLIFHKKINPITGFRV